MTNDIEKVINHLNGKGVSIVEIREALGLEHGAFYSWRRSTKKSRQEDLAQKITDAFKSQFAEGISDKDEPKQTESDEKIKEKYIAMLEETVKELKEERDDLKGKNLELLGEIRQMLNEMAQKAQ
jgi:DNA-binding transcriptional MerR regulator